MVRVTRSMTRSTSISISSIQKASIQLSKRKYSTKKRNRNKDAGKKVIEIEELEQKTVKQKVVKRKPVPASYLKNEDPNLLKLMMSLPKEPTKEFVFDYLAKKDINLKMVIEKCNLDCFIFDRHDPSKSIKNVPDTFRYLTRNIIYQQLAGKAAQAIENRFLELFKKGYDASFPTPEQVYDAKHEDLRSVGLSNNKANYIKDLALHYKLGKLSDEKLKLADDKSVYELLIEVKGIGPWTIDMFLMSYLKRLDVLPLGDLGIKKGMMHHFKLKSDKKILISEKEMLELSKPWRPYRSVASWLMWEITNTITMN